MRPHRGPSVPSPGADATSSRAARPRVRAPAAFLALLLLLSPRPARALTVSGADLSVWLYVILGLGVVAVAAVGWFVWVRAEVRSLQRPAFLVMRQDRAARLAIAGAEEDAARGVGTWPSAIPQPAVRQEVMPPGPLAYSTGDVVVFAAGAAPPAEGPVLPADATLQFLPGRLECLCEPRRPDLRFVRQPGPATVITIGRANGAPDRHIHVPGGTVSRLHGRLRYSGGRWAISNLSTTNPLRVNGRPLDLGVDTCVLSDGDRLELGDVAFVFRER